MQLTLAIVTVLHVLPAVFWAGSTFVMARAGDASAERLAFPQIGAACSAILTGGALWALTQGGEFGHSQEVLAAGAGCALAAAGLQGFSLPAARHLAAARQSDVAALQVRVGGSQCIAAGLLAATLVCMTVARYV